MGLRTIEDMLFHFPLRYQDKTRLTAIGELREGMDAVVRGTIRASGIARGRRPTLIVKVDDGTGLTTLDFFIFAAHKPFNSRLVRSSPSSGNRASWEVSRSSHIPNIRWVSEKQSWKMLDSCLSNDRGHGSKHAA